MKRTDYRFTAFITEIIKEIIYAFPSPNFWEHIIVIRTHIFVEVQIYVLKDNF